MTFHKKYFLLFSLLLSCYSLLAQKNISGVVVSSSESEPLVGVTVLEKDTQNGTITDLNGSFSLTISNDQNIIVASFVGYKTQEINIGNRSNLSLSSLKPKAVTTTSPNSVISSSKEIDKLDLFTILISWLSGIIYLDSLFKK